MELVAKIVSGVNYFRKKLYDRCLQSPKYAS